jgi:hypothetical protein
MSIKDARKRASRESLKTKNRRRDGSGTTVRSPRVEIAIDLHEGQSSSKDFAGRISGGS